jgi:hypothetical protein
MCLGGEPTIIYVSAWLLGFYALAFAEKKQAALGWLAAAGLLALGLAAVQLLPFLELARLSDRVVLTGFDIITLRSFPPREVLTFLFPYFFGNPGQLGGYTEVLLGKVNQDWLISTYLGIIPLAFVFFAFRQKRSGFFLTAALVGLLLAFGRYTPLYRLVYQLLPGVAMIRFPVKYLCLTTFGLSVLAALGLDSVAGSFAVGSERYKKALYYFGLFFVLLSLLCLTGHFFTRQIFAFLSQRYSPSIPPVFFDILANMVRFNLQSLFNLTAYLLALLCLFWAAYRGRLAKYLFLGILICLTAADLLANSSTIAVGAA